MIDYIACGEVVPERVAAIVDGIARLRRGGLRAGRRRDRRAPGPARPGRVRRRRRHHRRRRGGRAARARPGRPGDVVIAMASTGLHSNGYSLVRHVLLERAGWPRPATSPSSAGRSARSCWSRPGSTRRRAWRSPARRRARVRPRHRRRPRRQPGAGDARGARAPRRPRHLAPAAGLRPGRARAGDVPQPDLETTLNMGVGMVALLVPDAVDAGDRGCSTSTGSAPGRPVRSAAAGRRRRRLGPPRRSAPDW